VSEKESEQTTGTPVQDGADAASAVSGTPATDDRDAGELTPEAELAQLRAERNLWLQNKSKVEQANVLERRLAEVQRERDELAARPQPTYAAVDPRLAQQQQAMAELQLAIQEAQYEAQNGDRKSQLIVSLLQNQYAQEQKVTQQLQLQGIPEDERAAVEKKMATGRFNDVRAAHEAVMGERYISEKDSLKRREKELEEQLAARNRGVRGTGAPIPVTAREVAAAEKSVMTAQEFATEHARVFNEQGPEAARAFAVKSLPGRGLTIK